MFTLRVPFELAPGQAIADASVDFDIDGLSVSLKKDGRFYVVMVKGLASERAAADFLPRVLAGLTQLMLDRGLAPQVRCPLKSVAYTDDPVGAARNMKFDGEVHGVMDGAFPATYPTDRRVVVLVGGNASLTMSTPGTSAASCIQEGMRLVNATALLGDERLQTAIELYRSFFSEASGRARLVTLVMALEALAEPRRRPKLVQDLLCDFRQRVDAIEVDLSSDEAAALCSLKRELHFRTEDSIRSQVRHLVRTELAGAPDVDEIVKRALRTYDARSTLVHDGALPKDQLHDAVNDARTIAKRVIEARVRRVAATPNFAQ